MRFDRTEIYGDVAANNELIGSVYGLAYDRSNKYLYASAFLKRHVGLGELGLGGIYRIDYHNGANPKRDGFTPYQTWACVDRPADLSCAKYPSMDTDAFGKIGKVGLGDLDISGDNTLWTVNLFTRNLVRVDSILTNNPLQWRFRLHLRQTATTVCSVRLACWLIVRKST
jgi:hypothetical protein